ncbi:MAG: hypothetical protein H7839_02805 [Magnetococcus sp. YQC-5]
MLEVRVAIEDQLAHGMVLSDLQQAIREGLIIREYIKGALSVGEVAELLSLSYENGRDWLHGHGIATMRELDPELQVIAEKNAEDLMRQLGIRLL